MAFMASEIREKAKMASETEEILRLERARSHLCEADIPIFCVEIAQANLRIK